MLDFYRPGAVQPVSVQICDLLNYVVSLTQKQLSERRIRIHTELQPNLPPVTVVGSQIQQVFINLILNSYDAMPKGGNLRIIGRQFKSGVEMLFQDNGPGIPKQQQSSIFEPFYSTKNGGSGLGLTVSYNIVTAHGGVLELLENHSKGACFRVYLPSKREEP